MLFAVSLVVTQPSRADVSSRTNSVAALCTQCHGTYMEGKSELKAPAIAGLPEWYLLNQLKKFREGGRGLHPKDFPGMRMRPMARTLTDEDVTHIAAHVAALPRPKTTKSMEGKMFRGEAKFNEVCASCHGPNAQGNKDLNAPPLVGANDWYVLSQLQNFKSGVRGGNPEVDPIGSSMRAMALMLTDENMTDLAVYINSLGQ